MTRFGLSLLACSLVGVASAWTLPSAPFTIDAKKAVIVAEARNAREAAEELQTNLTVVCGVTIPIEYVAPDEEEKKYVFLIEPKRVKNEQWAWRADAKRAVFRGTPMWAVLDFLERALGVRWPAGNLIAAPSNPKLEIACFEAHGLTRVNIRTVRGGLVLAKKSIEEDRPEESPEVIEANRAFQRRLRCGRHDSFPYGHSFTDYWSRYGRTHREYFAQRKDGLRGPNNLSAEDLKGTHDIYQGEIVNTLSMCVTSPGLIKQIIDNWREAGMKAYINICENDTPGQYSCHCPTCTALDVKPKDFNPNWETFYADRYVWFGNKVLEEARKYRKDVRVCYYGYNASQDPPKKQRPDDATILGLVPALFTEKNIADYFTGWKKAGAKTFFYRPNRHHYFFAPYLPVGCEKYFFDLAKYIRSQGTIGFDYDSPSKLGFFQYFQDYVVLRGLFYENETFEQIETHFYEAFGAAKEDARAYFTYWREQPWNRRVQPAFVKGKWGLFCRTFMSNLSNLYTKGDFGRTQKFLEAAEKRELSDSQRRLVAEWRRAHDHAKLLYAAITDRQKKNTERLLEFRRANGIYPAPWYEIYYGDQSGLKEFFGYTVPKRGQ